mgnify:CR=1 FL=1
MHKLIALYKKPDDVAAFMKHYNDVHIPLVNKTPGLQKTTINRITGSPMGEPAFFMIVEMHYADKESFDKAMTSKENQAAGKDLMSFAKGLVTLVVAEVA